MVAVVALLADAVRAQHQHSSAEASIDRSAATAGTVTSAMSSHDHGHDHQMGPAHAHEHSARPQPCRHRPRQQIVDTARGRWSDTKRESAEADGFKIFLPDLKQKMYHFTN